MPVTALQLEYSLLERTSEGKLIPMAQAVGMGVMLSPAPRLSRSPGSGTARIMSTLIGARRIGRFEANLTALGLTLDPAQQERLTSVSAPHLNFPAENDATLARIARNGGTTVDGGPPPSRRGSCRGRNEVPGGRSQRQEAARRHATKTGDTERKRLTLAAAGYPPSRAGSRPGHRAGAAGQALAGSGHAGPG